MDIGDDAADPAAAPDPCAAWKELIEAGERERREWRERSRKIISRYRSDRADKQARRFSMLWANTEVLIPTLYQHEPVPVVARRFRDRDPAGRLAARVIERNLSLAVEREGWFQRAMSESVRDLVLTGQGAPWLTYERDEATADEWLRVERVHWSDFGHNPGARTWDEVTVVWRRVYLSRRECIAAFGEDVGGRVPLDRKPKDAGDENKDAPSKATVYVLWDSVTREVMMLHLAMAEYLSRAPYPRWLLGRFPCPRPMFGSLDGETLVPTPDYEQYRDQATQIDDITARVGVLERALKLVGFVSGETAPDIMKGLNSDIEVGIVPVESWAMGQGRPMDNAIAWLPVREVGQTLRELIELREQLKRDIYEITGLSDILRGQTAASETATAQRIKAQWGGIRVRDRQGEVARVARDLLAMMADAMCVEFEPERLALGANVQGMGEAEQQHWPAALALLKGDPALRGMRVDVETDSTVQADQDAARAAMMEALTGIGAFLTAAMPIMQGVAQSAPQASGPFARMFGQMLTGAVRTFPVAAGLEEEIEMAMEALAQAGGQPQPGSPMPDPAAEAQMVAQQAQMEAQAAQMAAQVEMQGKMQIEAGKAAAAQQAQVNDLNAKMQMEQDRIAAEDRRHATKLEMDRQIALINAAAGAIGAERQAVPMETPEVEPAPDQGEVLNVALVEMMGRLEGVAAALAAPRVRDLVRGPDGRATGMVERIIQ